MTGGRPAPEPEELWAGEFGDAYVERNAVLDRRRGAFWARLAAAHPFQTALEVGCGQGANLVHLANVRTAGDLWGIDVNREALARASINAPGVQFVEGSARTLPFADRSFDLVFTVGVLIHQPPDSLPVVQDEIVRCARRLVLSAEYHADEQTEVEYHGQTGALFKRDYGRLYAERFPELEVVEIGYLGPDDGFDRVTYHLLERRPLR